MEPSRQTLIPASPDTQPRPADREIFIKPASLRHQERPRAPKEPEKSEGEIL